MQFYYKLHYTKHKSEIASRWAEISENKTSTNTDTKYVNIRNQWMQEYYDAEPEEVKKAVEEARNAHNAQIDADDSFVDWSSIDSESHIASVDSESSSDSVAVTSAESTPSSATSVTQTATESSAAASDPTSSETQAAENTSSKINSTPDGSTQEPSHSESTKLPVGDDRINQLLTRQR